MSNDIKDRQRRLRAGRPQQRSQRPPHSFKTHKTSGLAMSAIRFLSLQICSVRPGAIHESSAGTANQPIHGTALRRPFPISESYLYAICFRIVMVVVLDTLG
jgi:hypothetical protein